MTWDKSLQYTSVIGGIILTVATIVYGATIFVQVTPLRDENARLKGERDRYKAQAERLLASEAARHRKASQERTCMDVLPDWQKATRDCRATLATYTHNCNALQNVNTLKHQGEQISDRISALTRQAFTGERKAVLNDGERIEIADLSRQRNQVHERLLSLHAQLQCPPAD